MTVELSHYHRSHLGVISCDGCDRTWPCHLAAWGPSQAPRACEFCGGTLTWSPE